jgi:type VI secretion system secreted protein Hcp
MPFDSFLKVANVPGESTDDKHPEWIEVLSYSWGASHSGGAHGGSGSGERVEISDFSVVKQLDKASLKLFLLCATGEPVSEVTLELSKAGGEKQKYMTYRMSDVLVVSVRPGGSGKGGDALPLEEVSFRFSKIHLEYIPIDKTGKPQIPVSVGWDMAKNLPI